MGEQTRIDFYQQKIGDLYCSHVLNAIPFVDDNLSLVDRKKYLLHLEDCSTCLKYTKSLRQDFAAIEKLVPQVSHQFSTGEDYLQRVKSLVGNFCRGDLTGQVRNWAHLWALKREWMAQWGQRMGEFYRLLRGRWWWKWK